MNIEIFITVVAILIILKTMVKYVIVFCKEYNSGLKALGLHLKMTHKNLLYFQLSLLWVFIYFFSYYIVYLKAFYLGFSVV